MNPQHASVSGPHLQDVDAVMLAEPHVGDSMALLLDDGKLVRTSTVRSVSRNGAELIVDTLNSRYRLTLAD